MTPIRQATITQQLCRALKWLPLDKQPLLNNCVVRSNDTRQTSNYYSTIVSCSQMTPIRQATITQQLCRALKWLPLDEQPLLNNCVVLSNVPHFRQATIIQQLCRALKWLPLNK